MSFIFGPDDEIMVRAEREGVINGSDKLERRSGRNRTGRVPNALDEGEAVLIPPPLSPTGCLDN